MKSRRKATKDEGSEPMQAISHREDMQNKYTANITLNSIGLFTIIAILLYFNATEIMEHVFGKGASTESIADSIHVDSLKQLQEKLKHAQHTLDKVHAMPPPAYEINPKIDWEGCLYEVPHPELAKHIVPPPVGPVTLVCCNTTVGPLNIEVHTAWAPNGAGQFLDMVKTDFFSTKVGLFRALKAFLVQFGLAGDPAVHRKYQERGCLPDDPQWLPPGPPGREINGTKRFQQGYLSYAGAGKNSRQTQLIMAFNDNPYLGGGSPWEVPWGQLFGERSFETLGKIYTGYGEKPSQGKIMNQGVKYLEENFPKMSYMTKCAVTRENAGTW